MPLREIGVRISRGCCIHSDIHWKMDPRVKPEDDYLMIHCGDDETASCLFSGENQIWQV